MIWHTWLVCGRVLHIFFGSEEIFYLIDFLITKTDRKLFPNFFLTSCLINRDRVLLILKINVQNCNLLSWKIEKLEKNYMPAFCVWMHVLLIRVHRNWKLAKSLIGNDLAPTEDRSRPKPCWSFCSAHNQEPDSSTICCHQTTQTLQINKNRFLKELFMSISSYR